MSEGFCTPHSITYVILYHEIIEAIVANAASPRPHQIETDILWSEYQKLNIDDIASLKEALEMFGTPELSRSGGDLLRITLPAALPPT